MGASKSTLDPVPGMNNAQLVTAILRVLGDQQQSGGLEALVDRFVELGLGEVINSWISPLENQPVSDAQVRRVLGRAVLGEIAWQAGISKKEASLRLTVLLPQVIDGLTPDGRIPPDSPLGKEIDLPAS